MGVKFKLNFNRLLLMCHTLARTRVYTVCQVTSCVLLFIPESSLWYEDDSDH